MTVVLEPTVHDLEAERVHVLAESPSPSLSARERAATYSLTASESRLLRRLDEIRYLLGGERLIPA